jgi:dTDP-4-amino-4,6-dideoxygalactose transaminase
MPLDRIYLSPPHIGKLEWAFLREVFESNFIAPVGPMLKRFEEEMAEYLDIPYTLAVSSGTAAIHLVCRHLNIQRNDVVLASTLTFIGSVEPVIYEGGELVFIDSDPDTWTMDPQLLEESVQWCKKKGKTIKGIIPTDLYGQCADLDAINRIADKHGIPVILDSAESLGSKYKDRPSGKGAYASIYSFNGNKIITASSGGLLASQDKDLIDHARKLSTQAKDDFPYYHHTEIGYNYRMSNVLAAIGLGQLSDINKKLKRRREIYFHYLDALGDIDGISFLPEAEYGKMNCWLTVMTVDSNIQRTTPEQLRIALEKENIESRPVWKPMHLQPVFKNNRTFGGKVSEKIFSQGLCLPSGTAMTDDDLERIIGTIRAQIN